MRVYCTTIAGSDRHKISKSYLEKLECDYEFVMATVPADAPLRDCIHMRRWIDMTARGYPETYIIRSWGCKQTMSRAMKKMYDDGEEWAIIIQDDCVLNDDWEEVAEMLIAEAPAQVGSIAGYDRPSDAYNHHPLSEHLYWHPSCNLSEPCQLVRREYAIKNSIAMKEYPCESDWCYRLHTNDKRALAVSTVPLCWQRRVPTSIDRVSTPVHTTPPHLYDHPLT